MVRWFCKPFFVVLKALFRKSGLTTTKNIMGRHMRRSFAIKEIKTSFKSPNILSFVDADQCHKIIYEKKRPLIEPNVREISRTSIFYLPIKV